MPSHGAHEPDGLAPQHALPGSPMLNHRSSGSGPNTKAHRVIASLNREQVDFLDKIGKDALFSSGIKLSRTQILAVVVNVLKRLRLSGEGIRRPEQLEQRIVDTMLNSRGGRSLCVKR